jgi:hypothetical protein
MRTLRLSLAGTVILMLLAGLGGVVAAGDEDPPAADKPHPVSGTLRYVGTFQGGTSALEDGRAGQRDYGSYDRIEMDDARLSGTLYHVWNRDYLGDGEVFTGTVELVNDDGSWVGTMRGYFAYEESGRRHYWQLELTGTGAHDGLSTLLYASGPAPGLADVEGFVFPGTLPAYPGPVEVPA